MPTTTIIITKTDRNAELRKQIMDLRDERIRIQRKVAELNDIALWEPENFTAEHAYWLRYHCADIARIKNEENRLRRLIIE